MNSSPELRVCPSCARSANSKARLRRSLSTSGLYDSISAISSSTGLHDVVWRRGRSSVGLRPLSVEGRGEPGGSPRFQEKWGTWWKPGCPHGSEPEASDAHSLSVLSHVRRAARRAGGHAPSGEVRHPMNSFRRWLRQRRARSLAVAMRDRTRSVSPRPGLRSRSRGLRQRRRVRAALGTSRTREAAGDAPAAPYRARAPRRPAVRPASRRSSPSRQSAASQSRKSS